MDRPFYPAFIVTVIPKLLAFLPVTLVIMAITVLLGLLFGFLLARARLGRNRVSRKLAEWYTLAMRCTPAIVLLFIVYYALPEFVQFVFQVDINGIHRGIFVVITLAMLFAATMSEVMRSAYGAVEKGQREAAVSIGLSESQAFLRIVLPQAVVVALPNFGNAFINLMKEGALAYSIGLIDMMGQGTLIIARNYGTFGLETYIALAGIYWALTIIVEKTFIKIEKNLSKGKRGVAI